MKLKFRDKAIGLLLLMVFAIYAVFNYIVFPANKEVDKLKEKKEKVEALLSDIEPLLKETEENMLTLITCVENQPEYRRCIQAVEKEEGKY